MDRGCVKPGCHSLREGPGVLRTAGKNKKRMFACTALILASVVFLAVAGPRLFLLALVKTECSPTQTPALYRMPTERSIPSPPPMEIPAQNRYHLQNHSFSVSWELTKQFRLPNVRAFVFEGERTLLSSFRAETGTLLKTLLGGTAEESRKIRDMLGPENLQSEFALVDLCLQITPAGAGLFSSVMDLKRIRMLMIVKSAFPAGSDIYRFRIGSLRGFQFGKPEIDPNVYVYLYTAEDHLLRLKLIGLTQTEIDRILASFEPADVVRAERGFAVSG